MEITGSAVGGRIPTRALAVEIDALKAAGISAGAVGQLLNNHEMTKEEIEMATRYKAMRVGDAEFTARYLKGDWSAVREMRLLAMILSAPRRAA
jgi:hypothetical protein